ncbi:YfhO family protein [Bacillus sp. FJAT-29814]|uniref:YfhO family protein n=1 Tax=Bacillus sp. FJAT-29814 TaxID=1729688 RepID=UPI000829E63F|nr:YfhO family protein [Bacillus sp. FJAT-29814]
MKDIQKNNFLVFLLSFCLPIVIIGTVFIMSGIYPFGKGTVFSSDLFHQYIHFYYYFLEAIKGNESLLYSWNAGLGSNFFGIIAYYTSSPVLLILQFFPKDFFSEAIAAMILIKIGFCGISISYFIKKKFITFKSYEIVFFSAFYSLMSYNINYYFNVMWLDGVILLPLIILSVDSVLRNKTIIPYTILLSLMFILNFYISYMIGLFIFLYLVINLYQFKKMKTIIDIKAIIYKFLKGTVISIGISAFLTVPTFFQLLETLGNNNSSLNKPDLNFFLMLYSGIYDSAIEGAPIIYIGTFILLLVPIFFISRINRLEKVKWGTLLFILGLSFIVPPLNLIWHAGDIPNWFPYRYSFIFSFILLNISLLAYEKIQTIRLKQLLIIFLLNLIVLIFFSPLYSGEHNLFINLSFLSIFTLILYVKKRNLKRIGFVIFFLLMITELLFNSTILISDLYAEIGRANRIEYTKYSDYRAGLNQINKIDKTHFYRVETDINNTNNDSLTVGHSSFGHSSSMLSNHLIKTMNSLGFYAEKANYNRKGSTIFSDAILGQKYFISSKKFEKEGFKEISRINKLSILKNDNYLRIGYPITKDIGNINVADFNNPFDLQNQIYKTMFKTNETLFVPIPPQKIEYENAVFKKLDNGKQLSRLKKNEVIKVKYLFNINEETNFYAKFDLLNSRNIRPNNKNIKMFINNKEIGDYLRSHFKGIFDVGKFKNEQVAIELHFDQDEVKYIRDELFYFTNLKNLHNNLNTIDKDSFIITGKNNNKLGAKVRIKQTDQLLFLSIPWDEGWRITVDGEKVKPLKVLGSFMGIPLKKGEYDLQMEFIPKGLTFGGIISLISVMVFIKVFLKENKRRKWVLINDKELQS